MSMVEGPEGAAGFTRQGPTRTRTFTGTARHPEDVKDQLAALGIRRGSIYQDRYGLAPDPYLVCTDISPIEQRSPLPPSGTALYYAEAQYAYAAVAVRSQQPQIPDAAVRWKILYNEDRVPADIDRHGNPITNAAGEPIDPPLTRRVVMRAAQGVWHRWGTDELSLQSPKDQYAGKLNRFAYLGAPARCLRVRGGVEVVGLNIPHPTLVGQFLHRLEVVLEFQPEKVLEGTTYPGWDDVFLNQGLRLKTTDPAKPVVQIRENQADLSTPRHVQKMMLDPGGFEAYIASATRPPNYRVAEHYDDIDFSGLTT